MTTRRGIFQELRVLPPTPVGSAPALATPAAPPASPEIGLFSAAFDTTAGGMTLDIEALYCAQDITVTFGGVQATVLSVTEAGLSLIVPPHAAGQVDVVFTNPGAPPITRDFTYEEAVTPTLFTPIATSTDGLNWTTRNAPNDWYGGILWVTDHWVAVGDSAALSPDGATWTSATMPPSGGWYSLAFNGTRLVAVGNDATYTQALVCTSDDGGHTWVLRDCPGEGCLGFSSVIWTGSAFIACGYGPNGGDSPSVIVTSTDGATWVRQTGPVLPQGDTTHSVFINALTAHNGTVVGVGMDVWLSTDNGVTWTVHTSPGVNGAVIWDTVHNQYVETIGRTCVSSDGTAWTISYEAPDGKPFWGLAMLNGKIVAVGADTSVHPNVGLAAVSTDGALSFTYASPIPGVVLNGVASNGSMVVAVGYLPWS